MTVGERALIEATGDYAYGERGFPQWGIGKNATLIFDIEVIEAN
jgi:FKBP-type peptidyl-prolyl cis-trans isomerase